MKPDVVLGEEAEPHLLEDQLDLLLSLHRPVRLHLRIMDVVTNYEDDVF